MSPLRQWAYEFGVPMVAVLELERRMGLCGTDGVTNETDAYGMTHSEAYAQSQVVLEAPKFQCLLTRNNVGALQDKSGQLVRYGLFNESKKRNERIKSPDLVGFRKVVITPAMVGSIIGQFVGREMKEPGWHYTGDDHEAAQLRCIELGLSYGCDMAFATGLGSFK